MAAWCGDFLGISITQFLLLFTKKVNHEGNENNTPSCEKWRMDEMEPMEAGWDFNFLTVMKTAFAVTAAVEVIYQWPPVISSPRGSAWGLVLLGMAAKPSSYLLSLPRSPGGAAQEQGTSVRVKMGCQHRTSWGLWLFPSPLFCDLSFLIWTYDFLHVFHRMPDTG